ncbi:MAG: cytochrome c biogenesis protein ResB, partial [Deltaproteobacteria bacterium]|nr:cytochrome c biogenesis protein ResB [Deltaproteobacteria bacterium]
MKPILDFFGSLRLTLGLLLLLAFVSVLGTFKPTVPGRFELFYQTIWFRLLLGLLALNLVVCTVRTIHRAFGADRRLAAALDAFARSAEAPKLTDPIDIESLAARCRSQGYRTKRIEDRLLLSSRHWCRWSIPILHISILLIMAGAFLSELGFVGTINIYVGHQSDRYFDWDVERELPIGFTLRLDHFEPEYYPIDLRFATIDRATQEAMQVYTTREGERVALDDGISVEVTRFFPEEEHLVLTILRDGIPQGQYHALSGQRNYPNSIQLNYEIRPVAFRDPLLKQLYSQVSILEQGQVVKQGTIAVNQPLV